jgi:hypothetical protein
MIMNNLFLLDRHEVNRQYNERLQAAAQERLARRLQARQPGLGGRSRDALAQVLISLGLKFKGQRKPDIVVPA